MTTPQTSGSGESQALDVKLAPRQRLGSLLRALTRRPHLGLERSELAGLGVALAAGLALVVWGDGLGPVSYLLLWVVLLVTLALLARSVGPRLLGPVFLFDLIRTSRQTRYFVVRGGYVCTLLIALLMLYASWFGLDSPAGFLTGANIATEQMPRFAASFFTTFLSVQMGAVLLLTPVYAAGAIAEEKELRTLELLLTSDLHGREIVLGKLVSRLANLALVVLAGLPILGLVQFLGGVDPNLVLAGFAATGMTMVSVASLSMVNSIYVNKTRDAILLTYLESVGYLVVSGLCCGWLAAGPPPLTWPSAGNFFVAMYRLSEGASTNALGNVLPLVLLEYVGFHLLVTLVCLAWGARRLRSESRMQASGHARPVLLTSRDGGRRVTVQVPPVLRPKPRPPVGRDPILWKELYIESVYRVLHRPQLVQVVVLTAFILGLEVAGLTFVMGTMASLTVGDRLSEFSNLWTRFVATPIACLMLVGVAVRASTTFSNERDRKTIDGLLTTALTDREILWGKWWASILSVRKMWWCLGTAWALGALTGGVNLLSLPFLVAAWFIFAALLAGLGVWFSLASRTTLRATVWTLVATLLLNIGPWLFCGMCLNPLLFGAVRTSRVHWFLDFPYFGLTPPFVLDGLTCSWSDLLQGTRIYELTAALVGLGFYGLAALLIWWRLKASFGRLTGRVPAALHRRRPRTPEASGTSSP